MAFKPFPVGIDDFEKMFRNGYYYVDKTLFIKELLDVKGDVNLFTRPRRFGKTLTLSMLKYYFEDTGDDEKNQKNKALFSGLNIMEESEYYKNYMGNFPVINLTLKSGKQPDFHMSYHALKECISNEYKRHIHIVKQLDLQSDQEKFMQILEMKGDREDYNTSLLFYVSFWKNLLIKNDYSH